MSWLNPSRWLLIGAVIAALLGGWQWREHVVDKRGYARAVSEFATQAAVIDRKRADVGIRTSEKEAAAQVQIRTVTKTIIEKVPVYVPLDSCPLPAGFRLLHDSAAANEPIPDATAIVDGAAIPTAVVAETVVSNYGTCNASAARLAGLQEWVSAQGALK